MGAYNSEIRHIHFWMINAKIVCWTYSRLRTAQATPSIKPSTKITLRIKVSSLTSMMSCSVNTLISPICMRGFAEATDSGPVILSTEDGRSRPSTYHLTLRPEDTPLVRKNEITLGSQAQTLITLCNMKART
jgi:hypothetical protein